LILVDTNVLLDVLLDDRTWGSWSLQALELAAARDALAINPVIYAEISIAFARIEELEQVLVDGAPTASGAAPASRGADGSYRSAGHMQTTSHNVY
jgi:hypothetical protein